MEVAMDEQVYNQYYDTGGNYHWIGVHSGEHIVMTRDEAIKDIRENIKPIVGGKSLDMAIEALERKQGKWIKMDRRGKNVQCSKCGNTLDLRGVNAGRGDANFCPNCGADMGGTENGRN